jgi:hypothetical protein
MFVHSSNLQFVSLIQPPNSSKKHWHFYLVRKTLHTKETTLIPFGKVDCATPEEIFTVDIGQLARVNDQVAVLGVAIDGVIPVHLELPVLAKREM